MNFTRMGGPKTTRLFSASLQGPSTQHRVVLTGKIYYNDKVRTGHQTSKEERHIMWGLAPTPWQTLSIFKQQHALMHMHSVSV